MSPNLQDRVAALTPDQRRELLAALTDADQNAVAITGIGLRLPGATGPDEFWTLLQSGESAIGVAPVARWATEDGVAPHGVRERHAGVDQGGFLENPYDFDREAFLVSERELPDVDPQQRLALEVSLEALEDAGLTAEALRAGTVGVYFGASTNDHARRTLARDALTTFSSLGGALSSIASRVAYELDLHGPSLVTDCACASSTVSLHLACAALARHEIDLGVVGGVNVILGPEIGRALAEMGMLSPTGRCRPFDDEADGFVRGEGGVAVTVRRLADAQRDGDRIYAVVRGSALYQDGRSNGFASPNPKAQSEVIRRALRAAHATPDQLEFIEASGTGTPLGDRLEARAMASAFGERSKPIFVSSLKGAIGHLEAASGLAAVVKACLVFRHGVLPRAAGLRRVADAIRSEPSLSFVDGDTPRSIPPDAMAGVSSFGFGGTNCHVVLGAPPQGVPAEPAEAKATCIFISARSAGALRRRVESLCDWLAPRTNEIALNDLAHTLATRRQIHRHRAAYVAASCRELLERFNADAACETLAPANSQQDLSEDLEDLARRAQAAGIDARPPRAPAPRSAAVLTRLESQGPKGHAELQLPELLAVLFEAGFDFDFGAFAPRGQVLTLPSYPWDRAASQAVPRADLGAASRRAASENPDFELARSWMHELHWTPLGPSPEGPGRAASDPPRLALLGHSTASRSLQNMARAAGCVAELLSRDVQAADLAGFDRVLAFEPDVDPAEVAASPVAAAACFLAAAEVVQTVSQAANGRRLDLTFVSIGGYGASSPVLGGPAPQRVLDGILRVAPFEHPFLRCRWVDLEAGDPEELETTLRHVLAAPEEDMLRIRGARTLVPRLLSSHALVDHWPRPAMDDSGTAIVAGAGFVGRRLAAGLLAHGAGNLVILSRGRGAEALAAELSAQHPTASIRWAAVDLADEAETRAVLDDALLGLPPVSAGYLCVKSSEDDGLSALKGTTMGGFRNAAACALTLHEILPSEAHLTIIGSIVAVLGAPESALTAATEAFWTAVCDLRRAQGGGASFLAWGPWADTDATDETGAASMINLAAPGLAVSLTLASPARASCPLAVIPFDLVGLLRSFPRAAGASLLRTVAADASLPQGPQRLFVRPDLAHLFVDPRSEVEAKLAAIWRRALSIDRVGALDDFFELGGDSIVGGTIIDEVNRTYGVTLTTELAFAAFTIEKLAEFVEAELVKRVLTLTDEELEAMSMEAS